MFLLPNNTRLITSLLGCCLLIGGCSTLNRKSPAPVVTVCDRVTEPTREPLRTFTFYELPASTKSVDGVELKAGLSEDGVVAILDNLAKLQKREGKWRGRAAAVNTCIDTEAAQRAQTNNRNK